MRGIEDWLKSIGLSEYAQRFVENDIDWTILGGLTDQDFKEIGVASLGHRKRLLTAIGELNNAPSEPGTASRAPLDTRAPSGGSTTARIGERRYLTVMFCDLVGSTSMAAKLDPEDWGNLVSAYLDAASAAVNQFDGHVLKKLGDGLMALFGFPYAQENDAERAVRAALGIQKALADLNVKNVGTGAPDLVVRIGLASGPVVVDAAGEVFGDAPNIAARTQAAAEPGSVLVTMTVHRQVAGLFVAEEQGARELRGVSEPVQLFRIIRASGAGRRGGARVLTPFVGREEEQGVLVRRWERARAGEGQLVLIVGEPGLGKSRLIKEFNARLAETPHTWTEWSASQLLQNTPLHPIAEWGRLRFGADAPAKQRLADLESTLRLIGQDPVEYSPLIAPLVDIALPPSRIANFPPEELRRRQLAAMTALVLAGARSQPAVLAFEDLHWADPTSLDLVRALADRGAQAPLLLIATARPEFRPPWSLRSHHSVISLSPLARAEVERMVGELTQRHALSKDVIEDVSERTGGVPLFVEEVTRLLLERGEDSGSHAIPPTLQQSLAARLDRLGAAREVAQIGAVLGRNFAHPLLRDVAEIDEPVLQTSLDRLADAGLLFVEGAPPLANYRFKHALIQDAAYDSVLKSRRLALHRRAAEILSQNPEAEPEIVAHHYTQAGLDDLAIDWWGKAGDQALRRSAFQEATAHLRKAIEMADKAMAVASQREGEETSASSRRMKLQSDYGKALRWSKGFADEETKAAFDRAAELAATSEDFSERFAARSGQWTLAQVRGELRKARELASAFLREPESAGRLMEVGVAHRGLAFMSYFLGDFLEARVHCEQALATCGPERDEEARERSGEDTGAVAMAMLALTTWQLGEIDRARELIEAANRRAAEIGHVPSTVLPLQLWCMLEMMRGDASATLIPSEALEALSGEHGMALQHTWAELDLSWAHGRLHDPQGGAAALKQGLEAFAQRGATDLTTFLLGLLAQLEAEAVGVEMALARVDEALVLTHQGEVRFCLSFLHRLRGDLLMKRDPPEPSLVEEAFCAAIDVAKDQGARSYHLQAALPLAKLYQSAGRLVEGQAVLAAALDGFSPTPEMPEIAEARALLAALVETDEVKAAEAQRRRRLDLQTSYGQALLWAKGFAAEETKAAFARAGEFVGPVEHPAARIVVDDAQCLRSFMRGEYDEAREIAGTVLLKTEGSSPEAGAARRMLGLIRLYQGDLQAAQVILEREVTEFQLGAAGHVTAAAFRALTEWHLGKIEDARRHIEQAIQRAGESADFASIGTTLFFKMVLESRRDDVSATRLCADELVGLSEKYGMRTYSDEGQVYANWARGRLLDPHFGADELKQALSTYLAQGNKADAPSLHGLLAELEAPARGPESALALIDQGLAIAKETGEHFTDPYLHRLRGELLLKRDPSNPAPAEGAFQTAISIAKEQSARSYELLASLSLAKLYRSINRPADARAVLAPALEGFSPTPEMLEIAEARALHTGLSD